MVRIRLFRAGTTKRPFYRIVAVDGRRRRETRVLESLGTYDPVHGGDVTLHDAAVEKWIGRGAQVSTTVSTLLRRRRKERAALADGGADSSASTSA